ncbi:MAG: N-acetylmuramic acid 6-phosphate etherase [Candidatus Eisenbacteria bacterium]|nr:N-acetylmuramic acid 6-phosphate etherase [Candidatus Eisenbacteria bacterium]
MSRDDETPEVFREVAGLLTESRNPRTLDLDTLDTRALLERINDEDQEVPRAVRAAIPMIAQAVDLVVASFRAGGRLIHVGAGTSGRLGVLDAAECPPTFSSSPGQVVGVIAGGPEALVRAVEGAEDRGEDGALAVDALGVDARDTVVGIAASRRTPFVLEALRRARARGARTVYLNMSPGTGRDAEVDVEVSIPVGPEVLTGSTRMKAGTAQKLTLNMISTAAMVRLGKAYENLMVDLTATSEKLRERSRRIVMTVTGAGYAEAVTLLEAAGGRVKTALVMRGLGVDRAGAERRLEAVGGFVRAALEGGRG